MSEYKCCFNICKSVGLLFSFRSCFPLEFLFTLMNKKLTIFLMDIFLFNDQMLGNTPVTGHYHWLFFWSMSVWDMCKMTAVYYINTWLISAKRLQFVNKDIRLNKFTTYLTKNKWQCQYQRAGRIKLVFNRNRIVTLEMKSEKHVNSIDFHFL